MSSPLPGLRVALFTDCFHQTNGVGTFCRAFAAYARDHALPLFCAYGGKETKFTTTGSVEELQLRRGPLAFEVDADLTCDPFMTRHRDLAVARLRDFRPDLIHVTGPGDVSILGLWAAHIVNAPTMAAWHTNVHEYAYRRLDAALSFLPQGIREPLSTGAETGTLSAVMSFYKRARFVVSGNQHMVDVLAQMTGRPAFLMAHGVDTDLFSPHRRNRNDPPFRIGYVGRLTPEKNVRALVDLERSLLAAGERDFLTVVIGEGGERQWLAANLQNSEFTGVLHGEALAAAFANLDVLVFPSLTDTFGLVMLEAMSSGVPVIVNPETGKRAGVVDGINGFLTHDFPNAVRRLLSCHETRLRMSDAARSHACAHTWSSVFEDLYRIYDTGLHVEQAQRR